MPGKVILGAQWGDEGKGKFIDIFAGKADLVVRSQGGNNAGHTVVAGGEKYKLQLIPSGILYPECVNVIGPGVVVNPKAVLGEIDGLHAKGVSTDKLFIDARCHCIMPWHLELDALSEAEKAKEGTAIGTTKKGIGPTYMDKSECSGIRMHDFIDEKRFEEVIRETCARKNRVITGVYGGEPLDADAIIEEYKVYADRLRPMVRDTTVMTYEAVKAGKEVLFEGAQGTLLDLDMGTYPYVTSSHPARAEIIRVAGRGNQVEQHFLEAEARHRTHRLGHVSPAPVRRAEGIAERLRRAVLARAVPDKTDRAHQPPVPAPLDRPYRRLVEEHQVQNVL